MVESILTWWRIVCTWGWCSWGYCCYRWRHSASNSYIQGMRRQFLLWTTPCKTHYSVVAYTMLYYQTLGLKSFWSRMLVLLLLIFHKKMHSHLSLKFCMNGFYMYVQMGPKKDFKPIVHKNTEAWGSNSKKWESYFMLTCRRCHSLYDAAPVR